MARRTLADLDVAGRRVLVRVDFNVPLDKQTGQITDDTRVRAALPTIQALLSAGAAVVLMSHLGRPKGPTPGLSLRPVAGRLSSLLPGVVVRFAEDCVGPDAVRAAQGLRPGELLLLENLRFHPEEEANDPEFARQLAGLGELYVNDAFGAAHRAHASTEAVARLLPAALGLLMHKEVEVMGRALRDPERPFVAVLGGAKVSDKMGVISNLLGKVDSLLIGGGMANTFLRAQGYFTADSLVEEELIERAGQLLVEAGSHPEAPRGHPRAAAILLPTDVVIADAFSADAQTRTVEAGNVPDGWRILDIGPGTAATYAREIRRARTAIWNGPMGVFELEPFAAGTRAVAVAMAEATGSGATTIAGGGESVAAIEQAGLAGRMSHVSTGGGASLEFLEGRSLPGVEVVPDR